MPQNSWGCPWLYMFVCLPAPQPGGKAGPHRTWHAHPPPEPVPLLPDGVHGGLGPVQLLLFAAQHGGQALILFPQPGQLLLPTRPFFSQVGIQVPAKYPLNLLDCLENTKTSPVGSLRERGGKDGSECGQRSGFYHLSLPTVTMTTPKSPSPNFQRRLGHSPGSQSASPNSPQSQNDTVPSRDVCLSVALTATSTQMLQSSVHGPELHITRQQAC